MGFSMDRGFKKGNVIFLRGMKPGDIKLGDVIVFNNGGAVPIIHRIVFIGDDYYQTKGDNNIDSFEQLGETNIKQNQILGKAVMRVPLLGYVKIVFNEIIGGIVSLNKLIDSSFFTVFFIISIF